MPNRRPGFMMNRKSKVQTEYILLSVLMILLGLLWSGATVIMVKQLLNTQDAILSRTIRSLY